MRGHFPAKRGKTFVNSTGLICHVRKVHTGERQYLFKTCNKAFINSSNLIRHMRVHTGERPFLCKTCGKSFSDKSGMVRLVRVHTGVKPVEEKIVNSSGWMFPSL